MDPLSITASIIAVVQVSHAVLLCCHRLSGKVQGAGEHISLIIQEVEDLTATLEVLQDVFHTLCNDKSPGGQLPLRYDDSDKPQAVVTSLAICNEILSEISRKLVPFSKPSLRSRLKWPFESERIGDKLKLLDKQKCTLQLALAAVQTRLAVSTDARLGNVESAVDRIGSNLTKQGDRVVNSVEQLKRDTTRREILAWLKTSDPEQNHRISPEKHEPETSQWLLNDLVFASWKAASCQSLWIHGIPGSGKTILASTIIDHLQARQGQDTPTRVIYYYFDFSDTHKQTVLAFLQSAVYQLVWNDDVIPKSVQELFESCKNGSEHSTVSDLVEVLVTVASSSCKTYIVVDALDECKAEQRALFFDTVMGSALPSVFNIAITSRKEADIEAALKHKVGHIMLLQAADADADVRTHVRSVISRDKNLSKWKPTIREEILEALSTGSNGMFRWAVCQLETIKKCLTPAMVRTELQRMPKTLQQTYDRILLGIDEMHQPFVQAALRWLAFASRPLTLEELSEACVIDPESESFNGELSRLNDDEKILELCGALATSSQVTYKVDGHGWIAEKARLELDWDQRHQKNGIELTVVALSHYSVKEYILSTAPAPTPALRSYHISTSLAHGYLASVCLLYLLEFNGGKYTRKFDFETEKLLAYSARYWIDHWSLSSHGDESPVLRRLFRRMFDPSNRGPYANWLSIWNPDVEYNDPNCSPGRYRREELPFPRPSCRSVESTEQPLYHVAALGDLSVCRDLVIQHGNNINKREGCLESPLGVAAFHGRADVVDFFLDHGADPNLKGSTTGSVLQVAAAGGNAAVVEKLIAAGADVNARGGEFNTALIAAVSKENNEVVTLLMKHGADITVGPGANGSALYQAAKKGDQKMVIMLLGLGADINEVGEAQGTPLYGAASSGSLAVVQILLRRGADVNKGTTNQGQFGYPVVVAAKNAHTACVRELIKAGADLNAPVLGNRGKSALEAAIESKHFPTFKPVFDAGASPNILGNWYENAFQAAIHTGSLGMAKVLLENGAQVGDHGLLKAVECYGQDPWFLEEILQTRKPDINAYRSKWLDSAMRVAIKRGGEVVAKRLLQGNPYLDAVSGNGSILAAAIEHGNIDLAKELVARGAGVHGIIKNGWLTCLPFDFAVQRACDTFSTELMDILLEHGADVKTGPTAAVGYVTHVTYKKKAETTANTIAVLKHLIEKGASLETYDIVECKSPLQMAVASTHIGLVRALLEMGANPNGLPGEGGYTLHYALRSGNREVVDVVLEHGVAVNDLVPDQGLLATAIRMGLSDLVPVLLENGLVKLLMDRGAKFLDTDGDVLRGAIKSNDMDRAREALELGLNPNASKKYCYPLEAAATSSRLDFMELLLSHGADLNPKGLESKGPLIAAVSADHFEMVRFLLDNGANPNCYSKTWGYPMYHAVRNENMTELLLSYGADVRIGDGEIFEQAIFNGIHVLNLLLAVKPHLTSTERARFLCRALQSAAYWCKPEVCAWLLDEGAGVHERGPPYGSPLRAAFANKYINLPAGMNDRQLVTELLLERGANINPPPLARPALNPTDKFEVHRRRNDGATYPPPLVLALKNASSKHAAALLEAGADVHLCGDGGDAVSPLQTAARFDPANLAAILDKGADVNGIHEGKFGAALHAAAFAHRADMVRLLLDRGADVNLQAGRYGTALQAAAKLNHYKYPYWTTENESFETLRVLVEVGCADVNAEGGKYGSALQMAAKSGNLNGVKYLLSKGADVNVKGGRWGSVKAAAVKKERWNVVSYLWRLYGRDDEM